MRTQEEIVKRIKALKEIDVLGFQTSELFPALDYDHVKPWLKEEVKKSDWEQTLKTDADVKKAMTDYMDFAWQKANGCRGISAGRTMSHYKAWTWLLGDEVFNQFDDLEDYQYYGKDNLVQLCGYLGLDSAKWDDNRRTNTDD